MGMPEVAFQLARDAGGKAAVEAQGYVVAQMCDQQRGAFRVARGEDEQPRPVLSRVVRDREQPAVVFCGVLGARDEDRLTNVVVAWKDVLTDLARAMVDLRDRVQARDRSANLSP